MMFAVRQRRRWAQSATPKPSPRSSKHWGMTLEDVRWAAAEALVKIGTPAVPALIQALGDSDSAVRCAAAWALGDLGDPQAMPALIQALEDLDEAVRRAAAKALGDLGDPQAIPALIKALRDRSENVRRAAAEALGKLGDPQAMPALIQALRDSGWDVRRAAAEALGEDRHSCRARAHPSTGG
jgi:HEAT repeat protein